jgi:hypothetical protein
LVNDVTTNNSGLWPEKLTADALHNSGAWVQEIGIQDEVYKLIINGVQVRNNHGYFKHGFFIPLDEMPTPDTVLQMMSFAANNLNAIPSNTVPTSVNMASLFPLGHDPVVWSTFIGDEKACQLCLKCTIRPGQVPMPGYWELHSSFVKVHFPSPLTPQLAHFFHALVEDNIVEMEDGGAGVDQQVFLCLAKPFTILVQLVYLVIHCCKTTVFGKQNRALCRNS